MTVRKTSARTRGREDESTRGEGLEGHASLGCRSKACAREDAAAMRARLEVVDTIHAARARARAYAARGRVSAVTDGELCVRMRSGWGRARGDV